MNKQIRQIIREEVYRVMQEIGEEDPVANAQAMVKSNEEQVKSIKEKLKWKENDARVSGLPKDEKDARVAAAKVAKDELEAAENELELAKQAEINAVLMKQTQSQTQMQDTGQSQVQIQQQV